MSDGPQNLTVQEELDQVQRQWHRRILYRSFFGLVIVLGVVVVGRWLGFNLAYLYAHRGHLRQLVFGEMLAPQALWAQFQGDAPMLSSAAVETLAIAGVGTALGLPVAFVLGLLAAANITPRVVSTGTRFVLGGIRAVPSMVYALLFVILAGLGPVAGTLAIAAGTIGDLGRLFADEIEEIDQHPVDAVRSTGAGIIETTMAARLPQVTTVFVAWILFYLEINARKSSVLGIVGAGGIGYPLIMAFRARNYTRVMATILVILVLVVCVEAVANRLREMLGTEREVSA